MPSRRRSSRNRRLALSALSVVLALFVLGAIALRYAMTKGRFRKAVAMGMSAVSSVIPESASAQSVDTSILKYREVVQPRRHDAWKIIGPGGGGTFYNPTVSPFDPNLVIATSDMTDSFITEDGGRTWRQINFRTIAKFAFDRKLPNRIFAITSGAGSYYTDDRGRTWKMFYPEPSSFQRLAYVDDEAEPYMAGGGHHVYTMNAFTVDPDDSDTLYASWDSGLWVTRDFGRNWTRLATGIAASQLFVDPTSPPGNRHIYVVHGAFTGVWDGAAYRKFKSPQIIGWISHAAFAIGPKGTPILYITGSFMAKGGVATDGGLMASEDGGETWRSIALTMGELIQPGAYPSLRAVAASRTHPEVIYVSYGEMVPRGSGKPHYGILKTTDGGAHWKIVTKEHDTPDPHMHDSWITQRFGPDWANEPLSMYVDDRNPDIVYVSDLGRIMKTVDGGENWEALYSQGDDGGYTTTGLDPTTCYGVHFDPFNPQRMFITYTDIGLFRSENGGRSWISSTGAGVPRAWRNTTYWLEFDPAVKGKMWAVMSANHDIPRLRMIPRRGITAKFHGGVVVSTDGGVTWKTSGSGLPDMAATHILLDPKSPPEARVLYVTGFGQGVFKSIDGGKTWAPKNIGLPENEPLTWRMAMDKNGVLYVTTIRRSQNGKYGTDDDGWVFRSRDGGESWQKLPLPAGLTGPVAITPDPENPARLYLSAWGRYVRYSTLPPEQGGVFLSTDAGETWKNVLDASRRIYDVTVDPKDPNIVYAGAFEAAVWRSSDRGVTWKRVRGFNFKHGHRVIPDPQDRSKIYITTFGSSVWHGPAEGDPNAVEDIVSPELARFEYPGWATPPKGGKK
jgi:photosystem II stability/assembly factor-like uncharacterized protein